MSPLLQFQASTCESLNSKQQELTCSHAPDQLFFKPSNKLELYLNSLTLICRDACACVSAVFRSQGLHRKTSRLVPSKTNI